MSNYLALILIWGTCCGFFRWPLVLSVDAAPNFVSSAYKNCTGCTRHQFAFGPDCEAARINDEKGNLVYAYKPSTGEEKSHPHGKCGSNILIAAYEKKNAEMLVVHVCGYSTCTCPVVTCSQNIHCTRTGRNDLTTTFNVSQHMCAQGKRETDVAVPTRVAALPCPVTNGPTKTKGQETPSVSAAQNDSSSATRYKVGLIVMVLVLFACCIALLLFHRGINSYLVRFKNWIRRLVIQPDGGGDAK